MAFCTSKVSSEQLTLTRLLHLGAANKETMPGHKHNYSCLLMLCTKM